MNRPKIIVTSDTELWDREMLLHKNVISPLECFSTLSKDYEIPINIFLSAYDYKSKDYNERFIDSWKRLTEFLDGNFSIQLHLHTRGIVNDNDDFGSLSAVEKDRAIKFGIQMINQIFGEKPNSFRAGGYRIGEDIIASFEILAKNSIKYDLSIAPNKVRSSDANFSNVDLEFIRENSSVVPIPLPTNKDGRIFSCERFDQTVVSKQIKDYKGEYFVLDFHSFFVHQSSGKRTVSITEFLLNRVLNKINVLLDTRIYFQSKAFRDFKKLVKTLKSENYRFINLREL